MKKLVLTFAMLLLSLLVSPGAFAGLPPGMSEKLSDIENRGNGGGVFEDFVKFSVLLDANGNPVRIIYQDATAYEFHQQALTLLPEFAGLAPSQIDALTYKNTPQRRAILGVLTIHQGDDAIHNSRFSLVTEEAPDVVTIKKIYDLLVASGSGEEDPDRPLGRLGLHLDLVILDHQEKDMQTRLADLQKAGIIVYRQSDRIDAAYTKAWGVGTLVYVKSQDDLDQKVKAQLVNEHSIVLSEEALRSIPPIAGLISAQRLTPASHPVLLAQMYGIPVVYHKEAIQHFKALAGRRIYLNANYSVLGRGRNEFDYNLSVNDADYARLLKLKIQDPLPIVINETENRIVSAAMLDRSFIPAYGGKSSQMGLIMKAIPEQAPSRVLGIPIYYFKTFLKQAQVNGMSLEQFVRMKTTAAADKGIAPEVREGILTEVRNHIETAKIPDSLYAVIRSEIEKTFSGTNVKLKLRSSSNVEDGEEFNGAGLYDSFGAWLSGDKSKGKDGEEDLAKGLKKVWASLYTNRGFVARMKFSVDESKAGMGVMVQNPFKGELANGVASIHVLKGKSFSFEIVGLEGEENEVTQGSRVQEEIVTGFSSDFNNPEPFLSVLQPYQGKSGETTLFKKSFYLKLSESLRKLAQQYGINGNDVNIEVEWKAMPDAATSEPRLFIKQVRPIPKRKLKKLDDGSEYILLAPENMLLRPGMEDAGHALESLWSPVSVSIKAHSLTERQLRSGSGLFDEVSFVIQGQTYTLKNPKITFKEDLRSDYPSQEISVALPNAHVKGLELSFSFSMRQEDKANVYSLMNPDLSIRAGADEKSFALLTHDKKEQIRMGLSMVPQQPNRPLNPWYDDSIVGTKQHTIGLSSVAKSKIPIKLVLENVREEGEGDARNSKMGTATVYGLTAKPLKIERGGIGYGSNHHNSIESFIVDLFFTKTLSVVERNALDEKYGRYLYLKDNRHMILVTSKGKKTDLGPYKGTTPGNPQGIDGKDWNSQNEE